MDIEDRKLTKVVRIGKNDQKRENSRTLLFHTENNLSKDLILKSTRKLKDYEKYAKSVYLSAELNAEDSKKENACLKKRKEIIAKGTDRRCIRIRNNDWITEDKIEDQKTANKPETLIIENENAQARQSTLTMLTYNVRSLLDTQRRTSSANAIAATNFDVICNTESWLTADVPNSALFFRATRYTEMTDKLLIHTKPDTVM